MRQTNGKVADGYIAPGTSGQFQLELDGSGSDVAIDYYITIDTIQKPVNMKFYADSEYTNELVINETGMINIDGSIALENVNTPVTETIYWNWPYETGTTQEEIDANDIIDTQEMGKTVIMPIVVIAEQQDANSQGLTQGTIEVISPVTGTYKTGEVITLQANYSEGVYANETKGQINATTAPVMKIKFGDGTEKTATFSKVAQNIIQYTYTVEQADDGNLAIISYTGTVYDKRGQSLQVETKTLSGNSVTVKNIKDLSTVVSVGDYVSYNPTAQSKSSVTTAGGSLSGTMSTSQVTKWRVLSIENGTVNLMAADPTTSTVALGAIDGYKNTEAILDEVCGIWKDENAGATSARSIRIEDVMKYSTFNPKTQYSNSSSSTGTVGGTKSYTSGTFIKGEKYTDENGIQHEVVTGGTDNGNGTVTASSSNPVTVIQTYYYTQGESTTKATYANEGIYNMLYKKSTDVNTNKPTYWFASRCVYLYSSICSFGARGVYSGFVSYYYLYDSDGDAYSPAYACVPVVSLKSNIQTSGQNESGEWQLVVE